MTLNLKIMLIVAWVMQGCKPGNTEHLKRTADKIDMSDSSRNARMDKFMDSLDKATIIKVNQVMADISKLDKFRRLHISTGLKKWDDSCNAQRELIKRLYIKNK